jgi:hypothetical protein
MSMLLEDIAEPLLRELELPGDEAAFRLSLNLAAGIWNAQLLRDQAERTAALGELVATVRKVVPAHVRIPFDEVLERARILYPDVRRRIASVDVAVGPEGECRINVGSTL